MVFLGFFNVSVARGAWAPGRAQGPREAWSLLEGAKTFIFLCFFIVFEAWGSLGNQKTLLFHCFFKVLEGEGREGEKKTKKINSFGDGLREPKPWFSLVFSMFPWPGEPGRLGEPRGREKSGARLGSLGLASLERGLCAYRHRYWYRY